MMHNKAYVIWSIDIALLVQVFLYFGYISSYFGKNSENKNAISKIGLILVSSLIWIYTNKLNGRIEFNGRQINNPFLVFLAGISGTVFVIN